MSSPSRAAVAALFTSPTINAGGPSVSIGNHHQQQPSHLQHQLQQFQLQLQQQQQQRSAATPYATSAAAALNAVGGGNVNASMMSAAPAGTHAPAWGSAAIGATGVPQLPAVQVPARFLQHDGTFDAKARAVFEEADPNRNRFLTVDDFRRLLAVCNVEFSAATVSDLFARADRDRDGAIAAAEWQQFAGNYPTLCDALYFRSKEKYEELRRRQAIENHRATVEDARRKEGKSRGQHDAVRRDVETQERNLALLEQELAARLAKEHEVRGALADTRQGTERAQREKGER
jgi:hypothetical protein